MIFKEVRVGKFILRFYPSDNGWMCGITNEMMDEIQKPKEWIELTDKERQEIHGSTKSPYDDLLLVEAKLKELNT